MQSTPLLANRILVALVAVMFAVPAQAGPVSEVLKLLSKISRSGTGTTSFSHSSILVGTRTSRIAIEGFSQSDDFLYSMSFRSRAVTKEIEDSLVNVGVSRSHPHFQDYVALQRNQLETILIPYLRSASLSQGPLIQNGMIARKSFAEIGEAIAKKPGFSFEVSTGKLTIERSIKFAGGEIVPGPVNLYLLGTAVAGIAYCSNIECISMMTSEMMPEISRDGLSEIVKEAAQREATRGAERDPTQFKVDLQYIEPEITD